MLATLASAAHDFFGGAGVLAGVLYVIQMLAQLRLYGFRRWVEFGLGTGVEIHEEKEDRQEG